jgi:tetratricopeptide (TPR) repeat protein
VPNTYLLMKVRTEYWIPTLRKITVMINFYSDPVLLLRSVATVTVMAMLCSGCTKVDDPIAAGVDSPDQDVALYLQSMLQSAHAMQSSGLVRGRLGMAYDVNGFRNEALATYAQAEALDPNDFRWPYFSALLIAETDEYDLALLALDRALAIDADYPPALLSQGNWLLRLDRPGAAIIAFERVLEMDVSPAATFGLARVMIARGEREQAVELLEQLVQTVSHPYIYRTLGEVMRDLGQTEQARLALAQGKDALPLRWSDERWDQRNTHTRGSASYNLAQHLSASGRVDEGMLILERIQGHHPEAECGHEQEFFLACNLMNSFSIAYDRMGLPGRAIETVQRGLAINSEFIPFHITIANLYRQQHDLERALTHLERAVELNPARGYAHEQRGRVLFGLHRYEDSKVAFETALQYEPEKRTNLFYLGLAEVELGNWPQAIDRFERVLQLEPGFALGHLFLARSLGEFGRIDEALQAQDNARQYGADPAELRITEIRLRELESGRE